MFDSIQAAPPDPILGISEAFQNERRDGKINLSVGVFKDDSGQTPVLACVKEAERRLLEQEKNKLYKPIQGDPAYGKAVRRLLFGAGSPLVDGGRAVTCHTPGGTGALRLAADFLKHKAGASKVWVSDPTWENHRAIFSAAGLELAGYRYFDASNNGLDFAGLKQSLAGAAAGDVVLLHACCHNPSGVDPTPAQWTEIAALLKERGALPLVDFAYQGFGDGIEADATGLRALLEQHDEVLVCSSFSKNFGLYNERTGALTAVAKTPAAADAVQSQLKVAARVNYSNPPAHGGAIVTTILGDAELTKTWEKELATMCNRIADMRRAFVDGLVKAGAKRDFSFITQQKGMFSFSGLNPDQVEKLKAEHAIYVVRSGRINVAGMTQSSMDQLCRAIVSVL
ncbi:MAG TPA: amino acid aminotransferase [Polyangiaceae bacterium]|jgi:aspartate/tyrosine/aromatic aminotransferase|nr:amino acid aminotransferase [Polyangiaceae bacterium]